MISSWPHRWALVLACATFPLVWVGGLVTTTDAGMAVPDWPSTYGYNLFLYPWQSWLAGPWDLFVEHGHRLLAAGVGMLTICLVIVLWRTHERRWLRNLSLAALALVIFQGVLGGMRVLLDERTLAMLHGCTGPLFFALSVAIVVFTSKSWATSAPGLASADSASGLVRWLAVATCILVYLQLVFGAVLRHVPVDSEPSAFLLAVRFHLFMAGALVLHVLVLAWSVVRHFRAVRPLYRLVLALCGLITVQLLLGAATWVAKFAMPAWAATWMPHDGYAIQADGWLETHIITAHVAVGSLLLATSVAIALTAWRSLSANANSISLPKAAAGQIGVAT
ncbi:MAG: COX15/CtaA family protein [Pirellulales bacterium]